MLGGVEKHENDVWRERARVLAVHHFTIDASLLFTKGIWVFKAHL